MFSSPVKEEPRTKETMVIGTISPMIIRRLWTESLVMFFIAKMRKIPSTPVREMKHALSEHMLQNLKWTRRASRQGGWELHRADRQRLIWWSALEAPWARASRDEPRKATHCGVFAPSVFGLCSSHAVSFASLVISCCSFSIPQLSSDKRQTRPGRPGVTICVSKYFENKRIRTKSISTTLR